MTTTFEKREATQLPAIPDETAAALRRVFDIPDPSAIVDVEATPAEELIQFAAFAESKLRDAQQLFDMIRYPIQEANRAARAKITAKIHANGGSVISDEIFDAVIEKTAGKRDPLFDVLFKLLDKVPADKLADALYIESIDVSKVRDAKAIEAVLLAGGKANWKANLVKLDKIARAYGGEVAEIIAEGSPRGEASEKPVSIYPRESAMKTVG